MSRQLLDETLAELRAKLQALPVDDEQKAAFATLFDQLEPPRSASARLEAERVSFARHLLDRKELRSIIRDRLIARFSVGKSQAYRDIDAALQVVPQFAEKWDAGKGK